MFGARQDEDGTWRLAVRKGRIIRGTAWPAGTWRDFVFKSQAKAKKCADELNEKYWAEFNAHMQRHQLMDGNRALEMVNLILEHCGSRKVVRNKRKVTPTTVEV